MNLQSISHGMWTMWSILKRVTRNFIITEKELQTDCELHNLHKLLSGIA